MLSQLLTHIGIPYLIGLVHDGLKNSKNETSQKAASALKAVEEDLQTGRLSKQAFNEGIEQSDRAQEFERAFDKALAELIHQSYARELASHDKYIARMRPTFGYIMAFSWALQMGMIAYVIWREPSLSSQIIEAFGALSGMWTIGLSVLGVYVYKRSHEKQGIRGDLVSNIGDFLNQYIKAPKKRSPKSD